jgi:hypothetical protein
MHFMFRKVWFCHFLEEDLKTPLPPKIRVADEKKTFEMANPVVYYLCFASRKPVAERILTSIFSRYRALGNAAHQS